MDDKLAKHKAMKHPFVNLLLFVLAFSACQQENPEQKAIAELELKVEAEPSEVLANELNAAYLDYINEHPEDKDNNARYLYRAATLEYRMDRYSGAASLLESLLENYRDHSLAAEGAHLLASIYEEKLQAPAVAQTIYKIFGEVFPNYPDIAVIKAKIDDKTLESHLDELYQGIFDSGSGMLNPVKGTHYFQSIENLAVLSPNYPGMPDLLLKAAETARTMRSFNKTLELYARVMDKYPDFEKIPQVKFLEAFTLDNDLKQYDLAKIKYEAFLANYPEHEFADDTKFLLDNLGKTDEDIIKNFEK